MGATSARSVKLSIMRGRQTLAAFVSTPLQDEPSRLGAHPNAEPVRLGAPAIVGLESSLHDDASLFVWNRKLGRIPGRPVCVKAIEARSIRSGRTLGPPRRDPIRGPLAVESDPNKPSR